MAKGASGMTKFPTEVVAVSGDTSKCNYTVKIVSMTEIPEERYLKHME